MRQLAFKVNVEILVSERQRKGKRLIDPNIIFTAHYLILASVLQCLEDLRTASLQKS